MINYKAIFPSSLLSDALESDDDFRDIVENNSFLKVGVVLEILEIDNERNQSGQIPEYDVMVVEEENTSIYRNCMALDSFGGKADFFQRKYRTPKDRKKVQDSGSLKNQNGSIVLMLCLDGIAETPIIIGSLSHPDNRTILDKDSGHHMEGEFNGINWQVNKDGALTISFRSATDNDGEGQDAKAAGTQIRIEKDGSVELDDGSGQSVRVEKTEKKVQVRAEDNIEMSSGAEIKVVALKDINAQCDNLLASCEGKAAFTIGSQFNVEAKSQVQIKSPMVKIQGDNLVKVESALINLNAATVLVGGPGAPALILTTQFMGIGNLGAPVMSIAIGPFSSKVSISS